MSAIKLSYSELETIASQLKSSAESMNDILNNVKMEFSKIGDEDTWSGTAASQTKDVFDELSAKFPEFVQAIDDCYNYLVGTVMVNYQAAEDELMGK